MTDIVRITLNDDARDFLDYREGSGGTVEIFDIAVGSDRRKGKGRALVSALCAMQRNKNILVWAITRIENRVAQEFYTKLRFHVIGVLYEFYDTGCGRVDAIMYGRKAGGPV